MISISAHVEQSLWLSRTHTTERDVHVDPSIKRNDAVGDIYHFGDW